MNYYGGFPLSYQPYYPNYQQLQNVQQPQPQQQAQDGGTFYFVNSIKDVEEWIVNAGQTAFFFDRNNPVFYIKSVAQNGLSQPIEVYDYSQRETPSEAVKTDSVLDIEQFVTKDEFNAFKAQIENTKTEQKTTRSSKKTEAE